MFTDSHAHIFFKDFAGELDEVLARARAAGVDNIICPGTDLATSRQSVTLAEQYPMVYACMGVHPHDAHTADENVLRAISEESMHPRVVAIGEIGLDYHYDYSPRDVQQAVFERQLEIAVERDLPVVIHCREADADCLSIVESIIQRHPEWRPRTDGPARGVFHCFNGDVPMAEKVIGWNFFVSFPGPLTFPARPGKPNMMLEVARAVPLDRVLIETDCPYLTPVPHRGKRNEPSYVTLVATALAAIHHQSLEEIGRITNGGVKKVFGVPFAAE